MREQTFHAQSKINESKIYNFGGFVLNSKVAEFSLIGKMVGGPK